MSFIYEDDDLVAKLLMSGLDWNLKFTKKGQAAVQDNKQTVDNVRAMVQSLQSQLDPNKSQSAQVGWEGDQKPTLDSSHLESLGDLVKWLVDNKVTVNSKRVAFADNEKPAEQGWILYRLDAHTATPDQRGQEAGGFYVNPQLLKPYIQQLQQYASQLQNPGQRRTMTFQLVNLVREANTDLGLGVSEQYQEVLRDTVVLDNVRQVFVDVQSSGYGGDIPLTYGDLKDDTSYFAWLKNRGIEWLGKLEGKPARLPAGAPGFDACGILKILMYRATHKMASNQEEKKNNQIYARQVSVVARATNCDLSDRGDQGSTDMQGGQGKAQQNVGGQGKTQQGAGGNQDELIMQIVNDLPLQQADIDFNRIRRFFSTLSQLMGNNPTTNSLIQSTEAMMLEVTTKYMDAPETVFQLGTAPEALAGKFKEKQFPGKYFPRVVQLLDQIVDNTASLVRYFLSAYNRPLSQRPEEIQYIYGQIGNAPSDDSIYNDNVRALDEWARTPVSTSSRI